MHKITEPVKQFALILALCLSVQMSAMSAPFVHVHTDADHDTDHHHGRTAHRHVATHDGNGHDHHGDTVTGPRTAREAGLSHLTAVEPDARSMGGVTAARATTITSVAEPVGAFGVISPDPATLPLERVGSPISTSPDISPPSLRGPPR